jgi:archaellum component FlaC
MSQKLTNEELQEIQDIRKSVTEVASILGDLNYQKMALDIMIDEQRSKVYEIKRKEAEIFEKIRSTYGNVTVNLETGEVG